MEEIIRKESEELQEYLVSIRRKLHTCPEIGFNLKKTVSVVKEELIKMGITPSDCGENGICALFGEKTDGKTILLRADMDALKIKEENELEFASKNGNMHACGHDMHTSMLLGAAKILKKHEKELNGRVKLMFQPAEELLEGSKHMIESGILDNPKVDAAVMIHVMSGVPFDTGSVIVSPAGISAPAADYFEITVNGKSSHSSTPHLGINALTAAANLIVSLNEICSLIVPMTEQAVLAVCSLEAGSAANIIPDKAVIKGSLRSFDESVRERLKENIRKYSAGNEITFGTKNEVIFTSGCPTLVNDLKVSETIAESMKKLLGNKAISLKNIDSKSRSSSSGSEDFAYVSQKVPSVMIALAAGNTKNGYINPLHHPKTMFDETALSVGAAVYSYSAFALLNQTKD